MNQILYFATWDEEMPKKTVMLWDWDDAPPELKALSPHGGDEDWVALVPTNYRESSPVLYSLLERWTDNEPSVHETQWGKVYIAAHA